MGNALPLDGCRSVFKSGEPSGDAYTRAWINPEIMDADRNGKSPYDFSPAAIEEIRRIKEILDRDDS